MRLAQVTATLAGRRRSGMVLRVLQVFKFEDHPFGVQDLLRFHAYFECSPLGRPL
jgi:hypothetical protein